MTRLVVVAALVALAAAPTQSTFAQGWHRMGGMPDMPAEMLKPPEGEPHHLRYHGKKGEGEQARVFAFGQPGDEKSVSRTVQIDIHDDAGFSPRSLKLRPGETVRFVVRNLGNVRHEFRIGDPEYQQAHEDMVRRMPGVEHNDTNAIVVGPRETGWIIWHFGEAPIVELASHLSGQYQGDKITTISVAN
jgi:uncharacterized cupredoxin-like copper-binding protein